MDYSTLYPTTPFASKKWPLRMKEVPEPPETLWMRGVMPPEGTLFLAVVGSRKCTPYGREVCEALVRGLCGYPITIVSGLALGVDTIAHTTALQSGLHCIAVPGSGIDDAVLYPRTNLRLAHRILDAGGALLSEFDPLFRATPWSFPRRNRIMVGLSHAVLLVEASERSGTLITARLTGEYNRSLLAVPGSIFSDASKGTHQFLKLGARMVTTTEDILDELGIPVKEKHSAKVVPNLSLEEREVFDALSEPLSRDALLARVTLTAQTCAQMLTSLELKGCVVGRGGVFQKVG